jgi:NADH-quinone oxidoreductase subunit L
VFVAWLFVLKRPDFSDAAVNSFRWVYRVLVDKFGFDWFNERVVEPAARGLGAGLWKYGDQALIDDGMVNGGARVVGWFASVLRYAQSGYLYHYAFAMILGLASMLMWLLWRQ